MEKTRCVSRRNFLKALGAGAAVCSIPGCQRELVVKEKPNIIIIMADDMGFSDIGCYGGEIETPNIDRLAASGLRYTQFYNTARCCPTRASLLTGLYPHQTGMGWMTAADLGHPGYTGDLNKNCVTIAEALKTDDYACYMSGKWHLTHELYTGPNGPKHSWPMQRGFDRFFGTIVGGGNYFDPKSLTRDNTQIDAPEAFYYTDAISDHAVKFIEEHEKAKPDQNFFMYVAYTSPHWPLHAKDKDILKYKGKYLGGWDNLRQQRYKRMVDMDLVDDNWDLSPRDKSVKPWNRLGRGQQTMWDLRMAIYAAQVDCMDQGIGRIVDSLKKSGKLDNTLIFFLSDNGGCAESISRGDRRLAVLGSERSFESYRINWANASNTPFRLYKHWVHEGGIATPLIVHWPAAIKDSGEFRHQPGHVIDLMATCLDVSDTQYPKEYNGQFIKPLEGKSLIPSFVNQSIGRDAIYWEHEANRAIRMGKWKLVSKANKRMPFAGPWELYDLEKDRTELNDLAKKYPDRVKEMEKKWLDWAKRCNVLPLDGRGWNIRVDQNRRR